MESIKSEINFFRNLVDDTLYGSKQLNEVAKRKFMMDKGSLGEALSRSLRNKIYNHFMNIIYQMKKGKIPKEETMLLSKRISIHVKQIKKLNQASYEDNKKGLETLLHWVKLTQIKILAIKNPTKIYDIIASTL